MPTPTDPLVDTLRSLMPNLLPEPRPQKNAFPDQALAIRLKECARGDLGKVGAPLARRVKTEFPFERGSLNSEPEELEAWFEAGTTVSVAETLTGDFHSL